MIFAELKHAVGCIVQPDPSLIPSGAGSSGGSSNTTGGSGTSTGASGIIGPILGPGTGTLGSGVFGDSSATTALLASNPALSGSSILSGSQVVAVEQNKCLLPPSYTAYVAWGFTDGSLRLGSVFDSTERARCVFEMVDPGEILCCTAPNKQTLVTAGISTVVRVWKVTFCFS